MNDGRLYGCASCIPLNLLACRRQKEMMPMPDLTFSTRVKSLNQCYKKRSRVFAALGNQYATYNSKWASGFYYGLLSASVHEVNCDNWLWRSRVNGYMNTIKRERKLP